MLWGNELIECLLGENDEPPLPSRHFSPPFFVLDASASLARSDVRWLFPPLLDEFQQGRERNGAASHRELLFHPPWFSFPSWQTSCILTNVSGRLSSVHFCFRVLSHAFKSFAVDRLVVFAGAARASRCELHRLCAQFAVVENCLLVDSLLLYRGALN